MREIEEFKRLGELASYHFADDSGKEWFKGNRAKLDAMRIYHANPERRDKMREVAKGFLWSLDMELAQ